MPPAAFDRDVVPIDSNADQQRLQQIVIALAGRGCHVRLSNSTADEIAARDERSTATPRGAVRSKNS